jgi:hypothetical protein
MWSVREGRLEPVTRIRLDNEQRLEGWLEADPNLLGLDIMIIGRQVTTDHRGRIDLLGIDRHGDLFILELKRDKPLARSSPRSSTMLAGSPVSLPSASTSCFTDTGGAD